MISSYGWEHESMVVTPNAVMRLTFFLLISLIEGKSHIT